MPYSAEAGGTHLSYTIIPGRDDAYDLDISIVSEGVQTAHFRQKGIPSSLVTTFDHEELNKNFFSNSFNVLFRNTYTAMIISELGPSYFPSKKFESFLSEALSY